MMKKVIKKLFNIFGFEISRIRKTQFKTQFEISGIQYEVDPSSVGETDQGELTARAATRMIRERQLKKLKILDICCGVGIVGLTIFSELRNDTIIKEVVFSDINIFNLTSLRETLRRNHLDQLPGNQIRTHLSNALDNIPRDENFDIIVSNPPHFSGEVHPKKRILRSADRLGTYDTDWNFHKSFYRQCHNYLTEKGEVWFLENSGASNEGDFLPFIEANDQLKYVRTVNEPLNPHFFWMITRKK